ncbi:MAG: excalibur calcium-binding domain-containing protein [Actinomycetia bacterium]|nr:excalibur calcium-binding domain-containing protein [Actinomycetes bacterium]
MVVEVGTPYPVEEPDADALELLPPSAGHVLDGGPAWSSTGGDGELVVTSHGLIACDVRSGECAGVDWRDFNPATDVISEGEASTLRLHFAGFEPVEFTVDARLASNIVALYPFDPPSPAVVPDPALSPAPDLAEPEADTLNQTPESEIEARADQWDNEPLPKWATTAISDEEYDDYRSAPLFRRRWFWAGAVAALVTVAAASLVLSGSGNSSVEIAAFASANPTGGIGSNEGADTLDPSSPTIATTTVQMTTTPAAAVETTTRALSLPTLGSPTADTAAGSTADDGSEAFQPNDELASTSSTTTANPTTTVSTTTASTTTSPTTTVSTTTASTTTTASSVPAEGDCHPAYEGCVPYYPGDALDCSDIDTSGGPVRLREIGVDPYGLDDDGDGIACEAAD